MNRYHVKLVLKSIGLLFGGIILCIFLLCYFSLDSKPLFKNYYTINAQAATQSQAAARRAMSILKNKQQPSILSLSQIELNGLNALLNRAFPRIVSDVIIHNNTVRMNASVRLPLPDSFMYLNISGYLYPSNSGIEMGDISIGSLSVSGNTLINIGSWFINSFIENELGSKLVSMIQWVKLDNKKLEVSLLVPEDISQLKQGKSSILALRDNLSLFGDVKHIKFYHDELVKHIDKTENISDLNKDLSHYIHFMFTLTKKQSVLSEYNEIKATKDNYSALMALAIYFGSEKFELLVGNVSNLNINQKNTKRLLKRKVTLRNRVDLQQHFIYSVALHLFGNSSASDAIGEFKEFSDSDLGGSGFSFADLLADRAGTRLAKIATKTERSAHHSQYVLSSSLVENDFMPEIKGIPEGISADFFKTNYRDVKSAEYKKMIAILDKRLSELRLYK